MTGLDWGIVVFALALAAYGYRRGFIVGALSFAGFAVGAVLGTRLGPLLLARGSSSPYAPAFGLVGALVAGLILATGLEGLALRLRGALRLPGLAALDGLLGALLSAAVALGIAWIASSVALQAPGNPRLRVDIQRSVILRDLNQVLPPSGPILNALARFDPLPAIHAPAPSLSAPGRRITRARRVRAAAASVVRVLGSACGLGIEGSGWVARPEVVVTNAHVVAGETDTVVEVRGRAPDMAAQVIAFDPTDDVAVLRVPGLSQAALPLAHDPPSGRAAAILGYPQNGPFDVEPGRIGATVSVLSQDAYGRGPVSRAVTPFRGLVRSGNSGGPLVDLRGRVVATVFAATVGAGPRAGYGVPNAIVERVLAGARQPVGSGACAH